MFYKIITTITLNASKTSLKERLWSFYAINPKLLTQYLKTRREIFLAAEMAESYWIENLTIRGPQASRDPNIAVNCFMTGAVYLVCKSIKYGINY
jgi:hypothetical protein